MFATTGEHANSIKELSLCSKTQNVWLYSNSQVISQQMDTKKSFSVQHLPQPLSAAGATSQMNTCTCRNVTICADSVIKEEK